MLKPGSWIPSDEFDDRLRSHQPPKESHIASLGQHVEYYSESLGGWTPGVVIQVTKAGDIRLDIKKALITVSEFANIRLHGHHAPGTSEFSNGDAVDYISRYGKL